MPLFFPMVSCGVRTENGDLHRTCRYHTSRARRESTVLSVDIHVVASKWLQHEALGTWKKRRTGMFDLRNNCVTGSPTKIGGTEQSICGPAPTSLVPVPGPSRKIRQDLEEKMTNLECPMGLL